MDTGPTRREMDDAMKKSKQRVSIKKPMLTRWKTRTGKGMRKSTGAHAQASIPKVGMSRPTS